MKRSLPLRVALFFVAAALLRVPSEADGPDGFQQHYEHAVKLYLSERYDDALAEFKAAYGVKQLARLLINIGQSYRKLGKPKEALDSYNAYLKAEPNPEPQIKQKVDDYIHQAQLMMESVPPRAADVQSPEVKAIKVMKNDRKNDHAMTKYTTRFVTVSSGVTVNLHAINGRAPNDLWAAGDNGALLHYDGNRWIPTYQGWSGELYHVTGSGPDDVWVVGEKGMCMHFDGSAWHVTPSPGEPDLVDVWTTGRANAWVADESGTIQHFDGTDWFEPPQSGDRPEAQNLVAAASSAPLGERWMLDGGAIARWNGKTLVKVLSGAQSLLFSIWQSAPNDVWAVGKNGTLLHYDGKSWKAAVSPTRLTLFAVWGTSSRDVWAAGGSWWETHEEKDHVQGIILHYDGKTWSVVAEALPARVRALWGTSWREVFAVGEEGAIYHYDGGAWTEMPSHTYETLWSLWGASAKDVWALGRNGVVLRYDGNTWSTRWRRPRTVFHAVWETAPDDVWAVGDGGVILHRDAGGWSAVDSGITEDLRAVWASGPRDAWAAGNKGVLLHWDGGAWSARTSSVKKEALTALWGAGTSDVWAGGERTRLLHYDGRAWNAAPNPLPGEYNLPTVASIWGSASNDVWAVGGVWLKPGTDRAILLHYDGTKWSNQPSSPPTYLTSVIGSGSKDVWVVGGTNYDGCATGRRQDSNDICPALLLHYNGKTWHAENGTDARLESVWSGGGEVWAVGEKGMVVKLRTK